jgi:ABC-2 type transport system permease protein
MQERIMISLLRHEFQSRVSAIIGWGIGLTLFGSMYISIFPEVEDEMAGLADLSIYQAMGIQMGTFEDFIASTIVLFLPILLGIYGIITSTASLAGEEDDGTLELVLAMPLFRWQIVAVKAIAMALAAFLILLISGAGNGLVLNMVKGSVDVEVTFVQLLTAVLNAWPISVAFMMMGMFLGAYLPTRRVAALATTVIFVASYFGENLVSMVASLDFVKPYSLFTYFDSTTKVFEEGIDAGDFWFLVAVAVAFFGLAQLSFHRRNVTVGAWPWQRSRG